MRTGEASTSPTTRASLRVIMTGSVGLVATSLPPDILRKGAIGALSRVTNSNRCTIHSPAANPATRASRTRTSRTRNSSRCSRKGISAPGPVIPSCSLGRGLTAERLQSIAGERRLVRPGVILHDAIEVVAGAIDIFPPFGQQSELVERACRPRRLGEGLHHLAVVRLGRVGVLRRVGLTQKIAGAWHPRTRPVGPQQLPEPHAGGSRAAPPQLLERRR